ncbi:hypothetical protein BDW66DRAFT_154739 [Aspergillus desertorum]
MAFQQVPVRNVNITSDFWSQMQWCSKERTIPAIIKAQKSSQHWYCLTWKEGHKIQPHVGGMLLLMKEKDDELMATVEEAVDMIRAAQHPDGYINSYYTVLGIDRRLSNLRDMHGLYCLGHLTEACVAYETITNSGRLLEPVLKALRHVDSVFGAEPGKRRGYPGHQEIEIGLLKGCTSYVRDANGETYFDHEARARGGDPYDHFGSEVKAWFQHPRNYSYNQADGPLVEAKEVKGDAVRAMYYYIAATDLVRLTGDKEIKAALDRMWTDITERKFAQDLSQPATEKDQICITRGPLVYCIEDVDNEVDIDHVGLSDDLVRDGEPIDIAAVSGVIPVRATGKELGKGQKTLYASEPWEYGDKKDLLYAPYFLRANRGGKGGMAVWARRLDAS